MFQNTYFSAESRAQYGSAYDEGVNEEDGVNYYNEDYYYEDYYEEELVSTTTKPTTTTTTTARTRPPFRRRRPRSAHYLNSSMLAVYNQGSLKKLCFLQTHNQGLCQLLLMMSWDLHT